MGPWTGDGPVQYVTAFDGARITASLTGGPEVSFSMPGSSAAALVSDGLATDVWAYKSGVLWKRARMLPLRQAWDEDGNDTVTVQAIGYRRVVERRHLVTAPAPTFAAVDQGAILWALVQHTQATAGGDLGVTAGTYLTGVLRDRNEYAIGDNLGTLMGNMSDVLDGCWWGIDADREFSARMWTDFPTRDERIIYGGNARSLVRDPTPGFVNAAGSIGSTQQTVAHWEEAADVATDPRGRWEAFDSSHGSVTVQATVEDYAAGLLFNGSYPPALWTVRLDPAAFFEGASGYAEGDLVTIVVPRSAADPVGVPPVQVIAQVTEVSVSFDADGNVEVEIAAAEQGVAA